MNEKKGAFRFTYFTNKYKETCEFYTEQLELNCELSWDRSEHDKGALFNAGVGLIEVLHLPDDEALYNSGLDYRKPEGAFMVIQVWNVDERFEKYRDKGATFKQEVTTQPWGHRSFSVTDPNGVVLFFYQEPK
ncbi:MAG: VOC family protein [Bacteroidota bacterium]